MELMAGDLESITQKLVEKAKAGNMVAIRLVLDKLIPPTKGLPVTFPLSRLEKAADLRVALAAILKAVSRGKLAPDEAKAVAGIMSACGVALAVEDLEREFEAL